MSYKANNGVRFQVNEYLWRQSVSLAATVPSILAMCSYKPRIVSFLFALIRLYLQFEFRHATYTTSNYMSYKANNCVRFQVIEFLWIPEEF